jgi:hypothetical protein
MATRVIKTAADYAAAARAIQDKLDKVTEGIKGATAQAVTDVAVDCISRAVERAPVEFGDLRGSGYASVNGTTVATGNDDGTVSVAGTPDATADGSAVAEIGFAAPYAFVQHEHVEFNHPLGGEAKYLESVVVENSGRWKKHLADSVRKGLRGDV